MVRTIDALNDPNPGRNFFINNPGFGNIFDILRNKVHRLVFIEKLEQYYGEEYTRTIVNSLKSSSLNSFYTPDTIVRSITDYLKSRAGFPETILEPSAGNGVFIRRLSKTYPSAKFTVFEKEILTVRILEHNFRDNENVTIYGIPFENLAQTDARKSYDLVVGNIPFGTNKVFDTALLDHPLQSRILKNVHSYFMYKSLVCLKPNGVAVLICTKNFMDRQKYVSIREHLMQTNNFSGGVRLPNTAFAEENTAIVTDILLFQNNAQIEASREQKEINTLFAQSSEISFGDNSVEIGLYFLQHPDRVLGTVEEGGLYNNSDYTVTPDHSFEQLPSEIYDVLLNFRYGQNWKKRITYPFQRLFPTRI